MQVSQEESTKLLETARSGDRGAADAFMPLVYEELRRLAIMMLNRRDGELTLSATALVHDAYLRMIDQRRATCHDERHFKALAATSMRRVLVDYFRQRNALKRGGDRRRIMLTTQLGIAQRTTVDLVELDDLLNTLAKQDERAAMVVELRFFGGMSNEEVAEHLGISLATAKRDWTFARSWLFAELHGDVQPPAE